MVSFLQLGSYLNSETKLYAPIIKPAYLIAPWVLKDCTIQHHTATH